MKELNIHTELVRKNQIEVSVKKQIEVEHILQGTITPKNGHTVFEIEVETKEIRKAKYTTDTVGFNHLAKVDPEKLVTNPGCVYIPALNEKNAMKKFLKNSNQHFYYDKEPIMSLDDLKM